MAQSSISHIAWDSLGREVERGEFFEAERKNLKKQGKEIKNER
jgi:hypothetical protein